MRRFELRSHVSYVPLRDTICSLCEPDIVARLKPVWDVDDECEMNSAWRDTGVENLWIMLGAHPV